MQERTLEVNITKFTENGPNIITSVETDELIAIDSASFNFSILDLADFGSLCLNFPNKDLQELIDMFRTHRLKQSKHIYDRVNRKQKTDNNTNQGK
jgi:hypothetical protein